MLTFWKENTNIGCAYQLESAPSVTDKDVLFSYIADWGAPGRWGVEICTRNRRFIWKPLEKLQVITLKSLKAEPVELDDDLDIKFKPGFTIKQKHFCNRIMTCSAR